jgi:pimeloyl-ACP methyl ester carboxylesterase
MRRRSQGAELAEAGGDPGAGPTRRRFLGALALGSLGGVSSWWIGGCAGRARVAAPAFSEAAMHEGDLEMEFARSADGTRIGYRRWGAGPPLVLVHGGTADHSRWRRIAPELAESFTVLALDRRGRGASGDGPEHSIAREAEDIAAVVDAQGAPADLLGHSYGGLCALEAALRARNLRRLVLYEPPLPVGTALDPVVIERVQRLLDAGNPEGALVTFFREVVHVPDHELALMRSLPVWPRRVAAMPTLPRELRAVEAFDLDPARFAAMTAPTLLLLGGDSPPVVRQETEWIHSALPDSRVVELPGQQHVAMDTAPELFLVEVRRFLEV